MFGCSNPPQGVVIVLHCMEAGISLLDWQARFHLVGDDGKKKPSMKAEAMLAAFAESGGKFRWINDGSDGLYAEIEFGKDGVGQVVRYTIEQAERAGLVRKDKPTSNWMARRPEMLRARVVSSGLRMFDPSIVVGVYTPEEIEDINTEEVAGMTSVTVKTEPASPPATGEQPTEGKKGRGRPPGSGMKTKETAAAGAGEPATLQPATEPQTAAAVQSSVSPTGAAAVTLTQQAAAKLADPPKPLADVNPVDPKAIDTPKLQFDRIMGKIEAIKAHWGENAEANWQKLENFMAANWGHVVGQPIAEENFDSVEEWADKQIAKYGLKAEAKSLEEWANGQAGK